MSEGDEYIGYYEWLVNLINLPFYSKIIHELSTIPFTYIIESDENRIYDGLNLRYRYAYEHKLDPETRVRLKKHGPCSVLEVMVAMALRADEEYMTSSGEKQVGKWFFKMIQSMNLENQNDLLYNATVVQTRVANVLKRNYLPNGEGSFFHIPNYGGDMRTVDLWYQMMAYLDYVMFTGGVNVWQ